MGYSSPYNVGYFVSSIVAEILIYGLLGADIGYVIGARRRTPA